ncbi:MAG: hypothetical protein R3E83_26065 [Burkholderiaceae bacterium]
MKTGLLVWGILGLWEYLIPAAGFGLQNPNFPAGTQLLHWLLLSLTGSVFIVGFTLRWPPTPLVTVAMYVSLATLCFVETVDFGAFGGPPMSLFIMAVEYVVYLTLAVYLLRSPRIAERFNGREAGIARTD